MKITSTERLVPANKEEEKFVQDIAAAVQGGLERETLMNNGKPFSCTESLDRYRAYVKTDLFQRISRLK